MIISITEGYIFQRHNEIIEVTDKNLSELLILKVINSHCEIITKEKAISLGYEDVANWSTPDDKLVYIDDSILLCCKENDIKS